MCICNRDYTVGIWKGLFFRRERVWGGWGWVHLDHGEDDNEDVDNKY